MIASIFFIGSGLFALDWEKPLRGGGAWRTAALGRSTVNSTSFQPTPSPFRELNGGLPPRFAAFPTATLAVRKAPSPNI
jgi:hypothetical protein